MTEQKTSPVFLIVKSRDGLMLFSSIKSAESYIEAIDVEDGEYECIFDINGSKYEISYSGLTTWNSGGVHIYRSGIGNLYELTAFLKEFSKKQDECSNNIDSLLNDLKKYFID